MTHKTLKRARSISAFSKLVERLLNRLQQNNPVTLNGQVQQSKTVKGLRYFDLVSDQQTIRCIVRQDDLPHPTNGQQVVVQGQLTVYDKKSIIQLDVQALTVLAKDAETQSHNASSLEDSLPAFVQQINRLYEFAVSGNILRRKSYARYDIVDLGDAGGEIRCVIWEPVRGKFKAALKNGNLIEVVGNLEIFQGQARVQLNARHINPAVSPDRDTEQKFAAIIDRLKDRGLWPKRKTHRLPGRIRRIGLITSPRSKALGDFLKTYEESGGQAEIVQTHAWVQGKRAAEQISSAINRFSQGREVDVMVVTRGGGSEEELAQAFDHYLVAEAICQSSLPVVIAVGHASDNTFADQVADESFDTPTRAAVELAKIKARRGLFGR